VRKKMIAAIAGLAAAAALAVPGLASSHSRDSNRDKIPDRWEKRFHLSLNVNQAGRDQDNDGLSNLCEFDEGDNPRDADTDNDGTGDDVEVQDHQCGVDEPDGDNNDVEDPADHEQDS
jgi:hypothetical protein